MDYRKKYFIILSIIFIISLIYAKLSYCVGFYGGFSSSTSPDAGNISSHSNIHLPPSLSNNDFNINKNISYYNNDNLFRISSILNEYGLSPDMGASDLLNALLEIGNKQAIDTIIMIAAEVLKGKAEGLGIVNPSQFLNSAINDLIRLYHKGTIGKLGLEQELIEFLTSVVEGFGEGKVSEESTVDSIEVLSEILSNEEKVELAEIINGKNNIDKDTKEDMLALLSIDRKQDEANEDFSISVMSYEGQIEDSEDKSDSESVFQTQNSNSSSEGFHNSSGQANSRSDTAANSGTVMVQDASISSEIPSDYENSQSETQGKVPPGNNKDKEEYKKTENETETTVTATGSDENTKTEPGNTNFRGTKAGSILSSELTDFNSVFSGSVFARELTGKTSTTIPLNTGSNIKGLSKVVFDLSVNQTSQELSLLTQSSNPVMSNLAKTALTIRGAGAEMSRALLEFLNNPGKFLSDTVGKKAYAQISDLEKVFQQSEANPDDLYNLITQQRSLVREPIGKVSSVSFTTSQGEHKLDNEQQDAMNVDEVQKRYNRIKNSVQRKNMFNNLLSPEIRP